MYPEMTFIFKAENNPKDEMTCTINANCTTDFAVDCVASIIHRLDLDLLDVILALSLRDIQ